MLRVLNMGLRFEVRTQLEEELCGTEVEPMEKHGLQSISLGVPGASCTHIYAGGLYQSQDTRTLAQYQKTLTSYESPSNPFQSFQLVQEILLVWPSGSLMSL